jgi:2-keto-4-pentenoate hydratase/2-oxohepta-3-ene-1,7-dioic acid hydratase in catechol pathway
MILFHYQSPQGPRLGLRRDAEAFDAGLSLEAVLAGERPKMDGSRLDLENIEFAPCIPKPEKIVCVGLNYPMHADETNNPRPERPIIFSKFPNALAASGAEVALPAVATEYDYEAELVVIIGQRADAVPESTALDYVWGYCNGNDLSARDLQFRSSQWLLGKTLKGFAPIGPWAVSRDEAGDLDDMPIRCSVNGQLRQSASVGEMIFSVPELIAFISQHFVLSAGDIIFTGTPDGVAVGQPNRPWLKPGDEVVVEVGTLGRLVNRMI